MLRTETSVRHGSAHRGISGRSGTCKQGVWSFGDPEPTLSSSLAGGRLDGLRVGGDSAGEDVEQPRCVLRPALLLTLPVSWKCCCFAFFMLCCHYLHVCPPCGTAAGEGRPILPATHMQGTQQALSKCVLSKTHSFLRGRVVTGHLTSARMGLHCYY